MNRIKDIIFLRAHALFFKRWRLRPVALICIFVILMAVALAILAPLLTPYSPTRASLPDVLTPPFWQEGGSWAHPLGTDALGRDMLSRLIFGARISLFIAMTTILLGSVLGGAVGIISGFYGGNVDKVFMRLTDATMSLDVMILALILAATRGPGFTNIFISIGMVLWARWARVIRGEVLSLKERDFIALARIAGCSRLHIMVQHVFPNVLNTIIVLITLQVGWVIVVEAALSFIGAGTPPPIPSWGNMVADGREWINSAWWISAFPGIAIGIIVLSFNLLGDWLRDTIDPKLRQV